VEIFWFTEHLLLKLILRFKKHLAGENSVLLTGDIRTLPITIYLQKPLFSQLPLKLELIIF
jgi:hypothetical protein